MGAALEKAAGKAQRRCLSFPIAPSLPRREDGERGGGGGWLTPGSPQRTPDGFDSVPLKTSSGSANLEL